jgi:hypothetical protein
VLDPLDPDGDPLREAIVIDEQSEEEFFDGIRRAEYQLEQIDPATAERLAQVAASQASQVTEEDMRRVVHERCWAAAGLDESAGQASSADDWRS